MAFVSSYVTLDSRLYHQQQPSELDKPVLLHLNSALVQRLQLPQLDWHAIIAGQQPLSAGATPFAMAYAGHQFGRFAGQLGDGRGLTLAQWQQGDTLWDLHLKGAGKTPYSRGGDGRAVLRSSIREYLAGHALTALGVNSTQAIGIVASATKVRRESIETAASVLRVADCHVRFGHFEWINVYQPQLLAPFVDYCIKTYYPQCVEADNPILAFARAVVQRTAVLIAQWQLAGFVHGVMNTDNMSITGSTLDFGPYYFVEQFVPDKIPHHSDPTGRYSYKNQPSMAYWNLSVFLSQLVPLFADQPLAQTKAKILAILAMFEPVFSQTYQAGLLAKMGLAEVSDAQTEQAFELAMTFLAYLTNHSLDYTNSFIALAQPDSFTDTMHSPNNAAWQNFVSAYKLLRFAQPQEDTTTQARMAQVKPAVILRQHMLDTVIAAFDLQSSTAAMQLQRLFTLVNQPFGSAALNPAFLASDSEVSVGCSELSCSS